MDRGPLWRFRRKANLGPHNAVIGGVRVLVTSGMIIECYPEDIGAFAHQYDVINKPEEPPPELLPSGSTLAMVKREGGDLSGWDIVNPITGQPLNDTPLTLDEAKSLLPGGVGG
jgi:hypothetical protein